MAESIVPIATPPATPTATPDTRDGGKTIICEGCGSRVDRRGNLLKRGDRLREALDGEETIDKLRKQLAQATETISERDATIADLRSQIKPERKSFLQREI